MILRAQTQKCSLIQIQRYKWVQNKYNNDESEQSKGNGQEDHQSNAKKAKDHFQDVKWSICQQRI